MQVQRRVAGVVSAMVCVALAVSVGACTLNKGCPTCPQPPPPQLSGGMIIPMCGSDLFQISQTIYQPTFAQSNYSPTVLLLSAGGSWGAWGAGILHSWLQQASPPKFDIVIGASTGALLGTFALIGDKQIPLAGGGSISMLDNLRKVYTTVNDADVYKQRSWFAIPFSTSINTLEPLRELIKKTFTHEVIDEVGRIYTVERRQLWVGTTNLDSSEFCNWNLSALAAKGKYDEYVDLLIASSANPGIFDPVYIPRNTTREHQDLHADGGVRHQLFAQVFREAVAAYGVAHPPPPPLPASQSPTPPVTPVTYAIVNGPLSVRRLCVENHIVPIMLRALAILQTAAMGGDLHTIYSIGHDANPQWSMKTSFIPDTYAIWPSPDKFPQADMKALFDYAATNGPNWYAGVPNFAVNQAPCLQGTFNP